ncbi:MAG: hypothetical protein MJ245_07525 [Clostridia bacterium]|nr:hypothetical protein [Clostridia bacterium]
MVSNLQELKTALDGLNIPVAYSHFNVATSTPYLVYYVDSSDGFYADNKTYSKTQTINIELYTDIKDETLEGSLETILNNNDLAYSIMSETYIDDEELYEVLYQIEI